MLLTDLKFGYDKLFSIYIDGEFVCKINDETAYKLQLKSGMEVSDDLLDEIVTVSKYQAALKDGIKILGYSQNTKYGLMQKLRQKGHDNSSIKEALKLLEEKGFINDEVYAENFVKDAVSLKKMGKIRIKFELRKKGVSGDLIESATCDIEDADNLNEIVQNEIDKMSCRDRKNIEKLKRRLYSKGYNIYEINSAIEGYVTEDEDY